MTWSQCLKRAFSIDIKVCGRCSGSIRVIVGALNHRIEDQDIIDRILAQLRDKKLATPYLPLLLTRAC